MRVDRGEFCLEVAGEPRIVQGYTAFLASMHYFSNRSGIRFLRRFPTKKAIDVGAAIGSWSFGAMRAWGWDTEIHAFEPNPEALTDLRHNFGHLPNLHIWPYACMNIVGKMTLHMPPGEEPNNIGQLSLVTAGTPVCEVETVRLDDCLPDFNPDFIKIDAEEAEPQVLLGAEKMLRRSFPTLYVETRKTLAPIMEILRDFGYTRKVPIPPTDTLFIHPGRIKKQSYIETVGWVMKT